MNRVLPLLLLLLVFTTRAHAETVSTGLIMAGTSSETRYFMKRGAQPGPTVVVIGGVHGDEPAGYLAARQVARWTAQRGTLVVLPDANQEAIRRNIRFYRENMNALFPGVANGTDRQRLAYQIFQLIRASKPNLVVTLHESRDFHCDDPHRYGQTFCFDFPALVTYLERARRAVNHRLPAGKQQFLLFVEPHPTCPTYQTWALLHVPATSIETCKRLPLAVRVHDQLLAVEALCDEAGLGYKVAGKT